MEGRIHPPGKNKEVRIDDTEKSRLKRMFLRSSCQMAGSFQSCRK